MPLEFSLAENVLLTHSMYIIQSSRPTPPPFNPTLGGFFSPSQMPPMLSKAPYPAPSTHNSVRIFHSPMIIFLNTRVQWREEGTWNLKYWREWRREGPSSGSAWQSEEEEEELPAHLDAHFGRISAGRLLWSLSFPKCALSEPACAPRWQAVVSQCVCLYKCTFVLWVFKKLAPHPHPTVCFFLFITRQHQ